MPSGLAGKAGKAGKAVPAAANQPASEAGSFSAASPAGEYPDWLASLTKPDKTLGELNRMAEEDRSHEDVGLICSALCSNLLSLPIALHVVRQISSMQL